MRQATTEEIKALPYFDPRLTLFYANEDDEFMEAAKMIRSESTIKNHPIGIVAVKDGKIIDMEANHSGFRNPWFINMHAKWLCVRRWLRIPSGQKYWLCPGCAQPKDHAESRIARALISKYGEKAKGSSVYLYGHYWCCKDCCDAMIKAGISGVVLLEGAAGKFKR